MTYSATSPYTGYLSPKAKQQQAQCACPPSPGVPTQLKDTTDLVLLVQSLYTQIRSLPLQNCLTSFDEKSKLTKNDLAYSVTSAHEDITQSRQDKTLYSCTQPIVGEQDSMGDAPVVDPSEEPYTEFATSLKSTLPLEFMQAASLKLINFEASHMQWGCIRVTGMYDESVGGRIAPEDFQDLTKIEKKRQTRTKVSSASSAAITAAKLAKRQQQKDQSTWTSAAQPVKADLTLEPIRSPTSDSTVLNLFGLSTKNHASTPDPSPIEPIQPPTADQYTQQSSSPILSSEDQFRARLQSLKRNGDRLFSSITSSMGRPSPTSQECTQETPRAIVLQESLLPKNDERPESTSLTQEGMQAYRFPPAPSPPLSIPVPRRDSVSDRAGPSPLSPEAQLEKTPNCTGQVAPQYGQHPTSFQNSPPYTQQHYLPSRHSISTSPLAHVITRRRSSRLSIVMNCDDSPDLGRLQSPEARRTEQKFFNDAEDDDDEDNPDFSNRPSNLSRRWGSLQDQRHSFTLDSRTQAANSPSRYSYLRRSSLNPLTGSHGDLFGSLVGSYEESILSGRMSTLPSKPLIFTAQIGVLANQDYKDCPSKLRCPKHVQLEFPAVFYDYESSSNKGHHGSHNTHHHHPHHYHHQPHHYHHQPQHPYHHSNAHSHHSHPTQSIQSTQAGSSSFSHSFKSSHSFSQHVSTSPSYHPMGSYTSSPVLSSFLSSSAQLSGSHGSVPSSLSHSLTRSVPTAQDDPILPYVGNLDLDSGFRGARRFARMPGGMRIPLRGQVQVMIKNPNKTVVKVFLVPYDFTDMPPGTKTFLRQKYYSTCAGMGPVSSTVGSSGSSGTLRYAIHLQFCCPAPGYVYLYRSIRVVFANRVPDGKESLRVVLEGLGIGSKTLVENGVSQTASATAADGHLADTNQPPSRNLEERYVKMRKGEVPFCSSKRKKDQDVCMDDSSVGQPLGSPVSAFGLGLNGDFSRSIHPHNSFSEHPSPYHNHQQERLDFDGQPYHHQHSGRSDMEVDEDMDMSMTPDQAPLRRKAHEGSFFMTPISQSRRMAASASAATSRAIQSPEGGDYLARDVTDDDDDYQSIPSSVLIGTPSTVKAPPRRSPRPGGNPGSSPATSSPSIFFSKESLYLSPGSMGRKEKNQILGI
ncbi:hypothetical protein BGZ95_009698 [Linnemannia exigua]|uniref:Atos-like conserved domain-containing protein n=1 Tax=Linnemannia exigua TaxID=604196 RepID=A0AAD4DCU8_9FUNG|nr:hypothetical protein BGZ95_009698 [Linnemannia exigua]